MAAKEPTVERRHREAAVFARYPWCGPPAKDSWAYGWLEGTFANFGAEEQCLNAIAQALAAAEQASAERAWDEGAEAALDGVPGGDEYASAIAAHARGLVNPYRQPKGPTK